MFNKIVNPETGRKVNTKGRIGKKIIKNYLIQLGGSEQVNQAEPNILDIAKERCRNGLPTTEPSNEIEKYIFFHVNRDRAKWAIKRGEAILRKSSKAGHFALSFNSSGTVRHSLVKYMPNNEKPWILGELEYDTIENFKQGLENNFNLNLLELPWGHTFSNQDRRWDLNYWSLSAIN